MRSDAVLYSCTLQAKESLAQSWRNGEATVKLKKKKQWSWLASRGHGASVGLAGVRLAKAE